MILYKGISAVGSVAIGESKIAALNKDILEAETKTTYDAKGKNILSLSYLEKRRDLI